MALSRKQDLVRRASRVRRQLRRVAGDRPRLSVHRSNQNIYAQIIDDAKGKTLVAASTLEADVKAQLKNDAKNGGCREAASVVGKLIAERAVKQNIDKVVFDRGAYIYHGRIKALAEAAREGGLSF